MDALQARRFQLQEVNPTSHLEATPTALSGPTESEPHVLHHSVSTSPGSGLCMNEISDKRIDNPLRFGGSAATATRENNDESQAIVWPRFTSTKNQKPTAEKSVSTSPGRRSSGKPPTAGDFHRRFDRRWRRCQPAGRVRRRGRQLHTPGRSRECKRKSGTRQHSLQHSRRRRAHDQSWPRRTKRKFCVGVRRR